MKDKSNSNKIFKARTIGFFLLGAFLAYGFGRHLFQSAINAEKYLGALLIFLNSAIVLFIGILFRKTLIKYNVLVGNIYLYTRVFEALALLSIILTLFLEVNISDDLGYSLGMLVLGFGSIPMCLTLHKHKIVSSWLAIWGAVGYAIFSFGFILELWGKEWSMYLLGPAGAWEITFAIWLIVKNGSDQKETN